MNYKAVERKEGREERREEGGKKEGREGGREGGTGRGKNSNPRQEWYTLWNAVRHGTPLPLLGLEYKPLANLYPAPSLSYNTCIHTPKRTLQPSQTIYISTQTP